MIKKLYETSFDRMLWQARQYTEEGAEDIVQEAFIKMINYQHLDHTDALKLLTVIVRNKCLDHLRKKKVEQKRLKRMPEREWHYEMSLRFDSADIKTHLNQLSDQARRCIELRYIDKFRVKEVAEIMDLDHSTVCANIKRGLIKLKTLM